MNRPHRLKTGPGAGRVGIARSTTVLVTAAKASRFVPDHDGSRSRHPKVVVLLDAVEEVWLTQGDLALTIRRLGTEAGTTTQAVYSYFGSMNALYNAAYTRAEHDIATTADTANSLAECVHYAHQHPARWHMIVTGHGPNNQSSPKLLHARRHSITSPAAPPAGPSSPA